MFKQQRQIKILKPIVKRRITLIRRQTLFNNSSFMKQETFFFCLASFFIHYTLEGKELEQVNVLKLLLKQLFLLFFPSSRHKYRLELSLHPETLISQAELIHSHSEHKINIVICGLMLVISQYVYCPPCQVCNIIQISICLRWYKLKRIKLYILGLTTSKMIQTLVQLWKLPCHQKM